MSLHSTILKCLVNNRPNRAGIPAGLTRYDNIRYGKNRAWHVLDLYEPADARSPLPVIINFHGGAWVTGKKEHSEFYCLDMARRGFAVINFSYRLAPRYKHPAPIEDCNQVVRWVLEHAAEYGLDADSLFLVGDSAGAHNAALYACMLTDTDFAERSGIKPVHFVPAAVCLNCGVYDLQTELDNDSRGFMKNLMTDFLGRGYGKEQIDCASPLYQITSAFPPTFLMSCKGDFLLRQVAPFDKRLTELGIEHITKIYGDDDCGLSHVFHCVDIASAYAIAANDEEAEFLKNHASGNCQKVFRKVGVS